LNYNSEQLAKEMESGLKSNVHRITILGAGPAGLSAGYYAQKKGIPFKLYEATERVGGNSVTLSRGDFLFDSGAHRIHDKDKTITMELKKLLGDDLHKLSIPSNIYYEGNLIKFPLSQVDLLKNLGLYTFLKTAIELFWLKVRSKKHTSDFKSFVLNNCGKTVSDKFLLNYSEKLWGLPCDRLCNNIGGGLINSLGFRTFCKEIFLRFRNNDENIEGAFYYPRNGFGAVMERLEDVCGKENILRNSRITRILHDHKQIQAIEVNGEELLEVKEIISTLPLTLFLEIMDPAPPAKILSAMKNLRYRNVVLVNLFLETESIAKAACLYFPQHTFPFTRVHEPKNRSIHMSPQGKTSLVVEIPCDNGDEFWCMDDEELTQMVFSQFVKIGWVKETHLKDASVVRLDYAYPVLEIGYNETIDKINTFLKCFKNLNWTGRCSKFTYTSFHHIMKDSKTVIEEYSSNKSTVLAY